MHFRRSGGPHVFPKEVSIQRKNFLEKVAKVFAKVCANVSEKVGFIMVKSTFAKILQKLLHKLLQKLLQKLPHKFSLQTRAAKMHVKVKGLTSPSARLPIRASPRAWRLGLLGPAARPPAGLKN